MMTKYQTGMIKTALVITIAVSIIATIVILANSGTEIDAEVESRQLIKQQSGFVLQFEKVTLEGHEYWVRTGGYAGGMTHSASCPCHDKD
jgi:hypothetical protein